MINKTYFITVISFFTLSVIFSGCIDNSIVYIFSGKGDPDITKSNDNTIQYFSFIVKKFHINMNDKIDNEVNAHVTLLNSANEIIFDGYTDNKGIINFQMNPDSVYKEGFYCVNAEINEIKYGNISEYGKLVFYYTGLYSIKKEIITYPVE